MNKWIIASIISLATAGVGAYAEECNAPEKKCPPKAECKERQAKMLEKFDANKDGKIDATEREAAKKAHRAEMLAKFDTNADGTLDETEKAAKKAAHDAKRAEHEKKGKKGCKEGKCDKKGGK